MPSYRADFEERWIKGWSMENRAFWSNHSRTVASGWAASPREGDPTRRVGAVIIVRDRGSHATQIGDVCQAS